MIELSLYISAIIIITIYLGHRKSQIQLNLQSKGLGQINLLKKLISTTQKHRGLSSAYLNGDKGVQTDLHLLKKDISQVTTQLGRPDLSIQHIRWESYQDHWSRLNKNTQPISVLENFSQHTRLIENLLYLLEDIAEVSGLNGSQIPQLKEIGFTWRELIQTAESVGQCRAIGVGIATTKTCSQVDKIRLSYLQQKLGETANYVLAHLSSIEPFKFEQSQAVTLAKTQILELNQIISRELVESDLIDIDPKAYFEFTTKTMNTLNSVFDIQVQQVLAVLKLAQVNGSNAPIKHVSIA